MKVWPAILVLCLASAVRADTLTSAPIPDPSQPIARISFPGRPWVGKAVFSKDGESLFVHLPNNAINLWEVFTYHWPEVLGALLILTALICCIAMLRVARSKRIPGAPHCRKCNYCLHEFKGDRCPECNHPTRRPIKGHSQALRLLPWSTALLALAAFYLGLWVVNVSRVGWASNYLSLYSPGVLEWAKKKGVAWIAARLQPIEDVAEYDTKTGELRRILFSQRAWSILGGYGLRLTPDGSQLFIPLEGDDSLALVDTTSGRITRKLRCPTLPLADKTRWRHLTGFDESGRIAYLSALDEVDKKTKLVAWNWNEDKYEILLETSAYLQTSAYLHTSPSGAKSLFARRLFPIPHSDGTRFLDVPSEEEIENSRNDDELFVRNIHSSEGIIKIREKLYSFQNPVISLDGRNMLAFVKRERTLRLFDLSSGKRLHPMILPINTFLDRFQIEPSHNLLITIGSYSPYGRRFVSSSDYWSKVLSVQDLFTEKWIRRTDLPKGWAGHELIPSPDGKYLAALGYCARLPEILIYELDALPSMTSWLSNPNR